MVYCSYRAAPPLVVPKTFGQVPNAIGSIRKNATGADTQFFVESNDYLTYTGVFKNTLGTIACLAWAGNQDVSCPSPKDISFNASWSNGIFGKSTKVQPAAIQLLMIIKA